MSGYLELANQAVARLREQREKPPTASDSGFPSQETPSTATPGYSSDSATPFEHPNRSILPPPAEASPFEKLTRVASEFLKAVEALRPDDIQIPESLRMVDARFCANHLKEFNSHVEAALRSLEMAKEAARRFHNKQRNADKVKASATAGEEGTNL